MASVASQSSASTSAYIDQEICVKGHHEGALAGLTFAVKDMYDVRSSLACMIPQLPFEKAPQQCCHKKAGHMTQPMMSKDALHG